MTVRHNYDSIDALTRAMNGALVRLFQPVIDKAKSDAEARALRVMLVAVLVNKAVDLIEGAPEDGSKGSRHRLQALAQDILDGKCRGEDAA